MVPTEMRASLNEGGGVSFSFSLSFILRVCLSNRSASSLEVSVWAVAGVLLVAGSPGG